MPEPTPAPTPTPAAALPPLGRTELEQEILEQAISHYHRSLVARPDRLGRLKWRGDRGARMVAAFYLGLGDDHLVAHLSKHAPWSLPDGERRLVAHLRVLGLLKPSGLETFSGSLVVPIRDELGRVLQVFGGYHFVQRMDPDGYLPGPRVGVFHPAGYEGAETMIVTETPVDALRFWYAGYVHVTSVFGGVGLIETQLSMLRTCSVRRVLVAFDDSEGHGVRVHALAATLRPLGLDTYRIVLHRRFAPDSRSWGRLVQGATPIYGAPPLPPLSPVAPDFDPWAGPASAASKNAEVPR